MGPSLFIVVVDRINDLLSTLVIKVVVAIKAGKSLLGDSDVGEPLGFGVGASLLGFPVVGEDVGVDEGL